MPNATPVSRRSVIALAAAAPLAAAEAGSRKLKLSLFSKHLQWTDLKEAASIAADTGFDALDVTVRAGGHVLPERVADDLPKAVETIRKAGSDIEMITAGIIDVQSPHAEAILRTAKSLGIRYYRWGGFKYKDKKPISDQLREFEAASRDLAAMNKEYDICAMYHTHSGAGQAGGAVWDICYVLRQLDPHYVGVNYDVGHATVEGGLGGWIHSARLSATMMRGVALKDFAWGKNAKGEWAPLWCAPGQGMVNFKRFFAMLKEANFQGPVQVHYEYPELGAAHTGGRLDIDKAKFIGILRRDIAFYRETMRSASLA